MATGGADLILSGGAIWTGAGPTVGALAVRDGRVLATGTDAEVAGLADAHTRRVDLGGRCVVPGLVDGHVHFVRAGRTWNDELRWEDVYSLAGALDSIATRAAASAPGSWIRVIGGWDEKQFSEGRGPTRDELDRVAPDHPVFVQMGYTYAQLNSAALQEMGLSAQRAAALPDEIGLDVSTDRFELDDAGQLTGRGFGMSLMAWFYRQLPVPTGEEQVASTIALSREFARLGLTGLIDGGGVNTGPDAYGALYEAWRRGELRTRVRLFEHSSARGREPQEFAEYLRYQQPGFGDDLLRVSGLGEIFLYKSHDRLGVPADESPEALAELRDILLDCARTGWPIQIHARNEGFVAGVVDVWEQVAAQHPVADLRWGMVHGDRLTRDQLSVLARLGIGVYAQSLMRFSGERARANLGAEIVSQAPPVRAILDAGVPLSLGSDAMRAASYNPFSSLRYFLDGLTAGGVETLAPENLLTREEALTGYTSTNAWFTHEETERGTLEPGKLADLAVLSDDYFTVPVEQVGHLTSELTLLGGRTVWSSGAVVEPTD